MSTHGFVLESVSLIVNELEVTLGTMANGQVDLQGDCGISRSDLESFGEVFCCDGFSIAEGAHDMSGGPSL